MPPPGTNHETAGHSSRVGSGMVQGVFQYCIGSYSIAPSVDDGVGVDNKPRRTVRAAWQSAAVAKAITPEYI